VSTQARSPIDRSSAWKILVSVLVVATALSTLLYASMKEEVQFWKYADEVSSNPASLRGKRLNVGGFVKSVSHQGLDYDFEIETRPPRRYAVVKGRYHGLVPDTFKAGSEVVATGELSTGGLLVATNIMAKCPSKYEAKGAAKDPVLLDGIRQPQVPSVKVPLTERPSTP
jgi:cytochrome c-type biogenesis protein CcmE